MARPTTYDCNTKTWSGQLNSPAYTQNLSVAAYVFDALSKNPDHIGQISDDTGVQLTNDQIRLNSIRLAINLQNGPLQIKKDDCIALVAGNHEKVSAVVFAAFALAAPINTLDPSFKSAEIAHMTKLTRPKVVFCESENIDEVRAALQAIDMATTAIITVNNAVDNVLFIDDFLKPHANEHLFKPTELEDGTQQTAIIVCSSGTTGLSKGVKISHALLLEQTASPIKEELIFLSFSSLYWMSGVGILMGGVLSGNIRIITKHPFEPELLLRCIEQYSVTTVMTAPSHLARILLCPQTKSTNLSSLKHFFCGGSALPTELFEKIIQFLPTCVFNSYATSETSGMVSICFGGPAGSVGTLKPGVSVRVIDEDGQRCGPLSDGEIYVKPRFPMLGYFADEQATRDSFTDDGWFKTGDIGHFDEAGFLFLVDRKKDFLIFRNYKISPSEIENVVLRCPGVVEVCVVGIPDTESNDLPAAAVVKATDSEVSQDEIQDFVKDTLSDVKRLRGGVYFVPALPTTPSGKVLRRKVQQMVIELKKNTLYA